MKKYAISTLAFFLAAMPTIGQPAYYNGQTWAPSQSQTYNPGNSGQTAGGSASWLIKKTYGALVSPAKLLRSNPNNSNPNNSWSSQQQLIPSGSNYQSSRSPQFVPVDSWSNGSNLTTTTPNAFGGQNIMTPMHPMTVTTPNAFGGQNIMTPGQPMTVATPNAFGGYNIMTPGQPMTVTTPNAFGGQNIMTPMHPMTVTTPNAFGGFNALR
jgi:hypothetical protein